MPFNLSTKRCKTHESEGIGLVMLQSQISDLVKNSTCDLGSLGVLLIAVVLEHGEIARSNYVLLHDELLTSRPNSPPNQNSQSHVYNM